MAITCLCPQCHKTLSISEQFAGQAMRCPLCQGMFQSPSLPPPPGPPPTWGGSEASAPQPPGVLQDLRASGDRLPVGWHMVRRGLSLIPASVLIAFFVLLTAQLILLMSNPGPNTTRMVKTIAVLITILASLVALFGFAMCSLVPNEPILRYLALGAAGCLFLALLALGITGLIPSAALKPTDNFFAILLAFAGGMVFLFFLRGVPLSFNNARQAQAVLYCIIGVGASPVLFLFIYVLLAAISASVGGDGSGREIVSGVVLYLIIAADLFWFLHVLRDVRRTVEKSYLGAVAGA